MTKGEKGSSKGRASADEPAWPDSRRNSLACMSFADVNPTVPQPALGTPSVKSYSLLKVLEHKWRQREGFTRVSEDTEKTKIERVQRVKLMCQRNAAHLVKEVEELVHATVDPKPMLGIVCGGDKKKDKGQTVPPEVLLAEKHRAEEAHRMARVFILQYNLPPFPKEYIPFGPAEEDPCYEDFISLMAPQYSADPTHKDMHSPRSFMLSLSLQASLRKLKEEAAAPTEAKESRFVQMYKAAQQKKGQGKGGATTTTPTPTTLPPLKKGGITGNAISPLNSPSPIADRSQDQVNSSATKSPPPFVPRETDWVMIAPRWVDKEMFSKVMGLRVRRLRLEQAAIMLDELIQPLKRRAENMESINRLSHYSAEAIQPLVEAQEEVFSLSNVALPAINVAQMLQAQRRGTAVGAPPPGGKKKKGK